MSKTNNPHDKLFKATFTQKRYVLKYLQNFIPTIILEQFDMDTLEYQPNSFITKTLREYFSDVVWQVNLKNHKSVRIALLFEHKSYVTDYIHFQILRYMLEIWEFQVQNKEILTPVIPIIFYHGEKPWIKKDLTVYFENVDETFHSFIPKFDYILTDVSPMANETFFKLKIGLLANVLMFFKNKGNQTFLKNNIALLFKDAEKHIDDPQERNFIQTLLVYFNEIVEISAKEQNEIIEQLSEPLKSAAMSLYNNILAEGKQIGMTEGIAKEKIEVIKKLHFQGMKADFIANIVDMTIKEVTKIVESLKNEKNNG